MKQCQGHGVYDIFPQFSSTQAIFCDTSTQVGDVATPLDFVYLMPYALVFTTNVSLLCTDTKISTNHLSMTSLWYLSKMGGTYFGTNHLRMTSLWRHNVSISWKWGDIGKVHENRPKMDFRLKILKTCKFHLFFFFLAKYVRKRHF